MALPVLFDTDLSVGLQNSYHGPFKGSNGAIYTVLRNDTSGTGTGVISLHKATDPTSSFTQVATVTMGSVGANQAPIFCFQKDDIIHITSQRDDTSARHVLYTSANLANDTLITSLSIESINTHDDGPDAHACSIAVRDDGDIVVMYQGNPDMDMGTEFARIDANISTNGGTSWGGPIAVDNAGADHWTGCIIVPGDSDRMHLFFKNNDLNDGYQRTLKSDDNLEAFPSSYDDNSGSDVYGHYHGVSFLSGADTKVRTPYNSATSGRPSIVGFNSDDAPTQSIIEANPIAVSGTLCCLSVDFDIQHLLARHVALSNDLYINDTGADNDTWGTTTEELDAVTINHISCNIYDRDGTKLAYIYDDDGAVKYNEVDIKAAIALLSDVKFSDQNYFHGPFDI